MHWRLFRTFFVHLYLHILLAVVHDIRTVRVCNVVNLVRSKLASMQHKNSTFMAKHLVPHFGLGPQACRKARVQWLRAHQTTTKVNRTYEAAKVRSILLDSRLRVHEHQHNLHPTPSGATCINLSLMRNSSSALGQTRYVA